MTPIRMDYLMSISLTNTLLMQLLLIHLKGAFTLLAFSGVAGTSRLQLVIKKCSYGSGQEEQPRNGKFKFFRVMPKPRASRG
ncbi:MAG: hypothetical protein CM15mP38_0150 [Synechococcus sp.]|nr:MAG: hypothetical protein CM15mP38_0150 [Synechococcus sp.]